jgi:hypothetical protein
MFSQNLVRVREHPIPLGGYAGKSPFVPAYNRGSSMEDGWKSVIEPERRYLALDEDVRWRLENMNVLTGGGHFIPPNN